MSGTRLGWVAGLAVAVAAGPAWGEGGARGHGAGATADRAVLLAEHLPEQLARERPRGARAAGILLGGSALLLGGATLGTGALDLGRPSDALFGGALLTAVVGGASTLLVHESAALPLVEATAHTSLGLLVLGQDLELNGRPSAGGVAASAGFGAAGLLSLVNALGPPRPTRAELRADLERVRTPARRAVASAGAVREIEADLRRSRLPVAPSYAHAPLVLGGATGVIAGVLDERSRSAVWASALSLAVGVAGMSRGVAFDDYETAVRRAGLRVAAAPGPGDRGGLSFVVAF